MIVIRGKRIRPSTVRGVFHSLITIGDMDNQCPKASQSTKRSHHWDIFVSKKHDVYMWVETWRNIDVFPCGASVNVVMTMF